MGGGGGERACHSCLYHPTPMHCKDRIICIPKISNLTILIEKCSSHSLAASRVCSQRRSWGPASASSACCRYSSTRRAASRWSAAASTTPAHWTSCASCTARAACAPSSGAPARRFSATFQPPPPTSPPTKCSRTLSHRKTPSELSSPLCSLRSLLSSCHSHHFLSYQCSNQNSLVTQLACNTHACIHFICIRYS